jgi:hypothetical protein
LGLRIVTHLPQFPRQEPGIWGRPASRNDPVGVQGRAMKYTAVGETGKINVSPLAFRLWAKQYYQCRLSFKCADFSPVPYFLLCRAIELQFKALHLEGKRQSDVKNNYGHDLIKSYNDLPTVDRVLSREQLSLLEKANKIYKTKGFEYFNVGDAVRGFSDFPDLKALDALAAKIVEI